jgi:protein ImuB
LHDVGIYTIGQLLELPRHTLATRFGKHTVYRLSQLLGAIEERFHSVAPTKRYSKHKVFEPPLLHRHAITLAIEHLFTTLLEELRHNHSTAQLFSLILTDTTGHAIRKELPLASASHDPSHLSAIMQPIIDNLHFCGELRDILIEAHTIVSTHHEQQSFTSDTHQDPNVIQRSYNEMLNAFSVRIGKDRISYAHCTHSYIPERSFSYRSALETRASAKSDRAVHQPHITYGLRERPPVLFTTPEPITTIAMLPDKPPSWIRWRNTTLSIISGIGPERIAPEWWQGDLQRDTFSERDYFTIQDTFGRWLWVFREQRSQQWFMHGVWT